MPTRIAIVLAPNSGDSRVFIDDVEITEACTDVYVAARVGEKSRVVLMLRAPVEIMGDAGALHVNHEPGDPADGFR